MRRKLLIGNWKMHKTIAQARAFAEELGRLSTRLPSSVDYAVCPPFTALQVLRVILPSQVKLGAQNVHYEPQGAFTGEISVPMLAEIGVTYVIVGHSERRQLFAETDDSVRRKVKAVAAAGMIPVLCVGEDLAQRGAGETFAVVEQQVRAGLADLSAEEAARTVIAYEPVWAIGTGQAATAEDAEQVIARIRECVAALHGHEAAAGVRILYGGSVKPDNIASFTRQPNIDGALVGGASLEAASFTAMAEAMGEEAMGGE